MPGGKGYTSSVEREGRRSYDAMQLVHPRSTGFGLGSPIAAAYQELPYEQRSQLEEACTNEKACMAIMAAAAAAAALFLAARIMGGGTRKAKKSKRKARATRSCSRKH